MKNLICAASLLVLSSTALAADVGVSISIGQPDFYGRIDIGNYPRPRVVYAEPIVVERGGYYREEQPIYLRVPPGHRKHWAKHCHEYNACGQRVYFVRDDWYNNEYAPRYREEHGDRGERHDNGHGKHDRHENSGRGNGHGHGHDRD